MDLTGEIAKQKNAQTFSLKVPIFATLFEVKTVYEERSTQSLFYADGRSGL